MKTSRFAYIGLISGAFALITTLGILTHADYRAYLQTPLPVGMGPVVIYPGTGVAQLARALPSTHRWKTRLYLETYTRLHGLATRFKAGEYAIVPGLTPQGLIGQIVAGRVLQHHLTIVEGWTFRQLRRALDAHPHLIHTTQGRSDAEVMTQLGLSGAHPEGRFFPDTYHFPAGTTDIACLQRALATMDARLAQNWQGRAERLPFQNAYEALILASIIEKETARASERAQVAGVFVRRMQLGMPLQTDPTVIYGLGDRFDGNLRKKDLTTDTPYNTYTNKGLPPTPIALPSAATLHAAVHPEAGDSLYFVANGQGGHVFSKSYDEHLRAVRQFQR